MILIDNRSGEELPVDEYVALAAFVVHEGRGLVYHFCQEQKWDTKPRPSCTTSDERELSISLVDSEEMHALNKEYRGIDAPTDVLAFENDGELLGDVIICPAIAREHALEFESDFTSEMELMLTHGILHLLGYDHIEENEAQRMENRENKILELWRTR